MKNKVINLIFSFLILSSCGNHFSQEKLAVENNFTVEEAENFNYQIIRYLGKLPGKADHTSKFDEKFDEHYHKLSKAHSLKFYYKDKKTGVEYFLITRIAPSIKLKKVAIGGKLIRTDSGDISNYEEIFRTWKMEEKELSEKSHLLFVNMIKGEDLSPYFPENSGEDEWIEFPNENVYFDNEKRRWISTLEDPLEDYYQLKR
jgi:hypothetical protein